MSGALRHPALLGGSLCWDPRARCTELGEMLSPVPQGSDSLPGPLMGAMGCVRGTRWRAGRGRWVVVSVLPW